MKLITIALYRIEKGERIDQTATVDNTVTKIEIEEDHYKITTLDIYKKQEVVYTVPTDKYEIVINKFF